MVGRIIGRQGTTIRMIQDQSGAHVDVPRESGAPYRQLEIKGTQAQIQTCIALIQQKIVSQTN